VPTLTVPEPPFLSLLVSGGHTSLYTVTAWGKINLVCETMDDAVGECFDKVAKIMGLEYPGGIKIERLAREYKEGKYEQSDLVQFVKYPKHESFSYSGLKTAVLNFVNREKMAGREIDIPYMSASFQHEAMMQLVDRCISIMKERDIKTICVCGGVSANGYLRLKMQEAAKEIGGEAIFPKMEYCTDNAAMIGAAAILGCRL